MAPRADDFAAHVAGTAPVARDPMTPQIARVRRRHHDCGEVWTLEIEADEPQSAPFRPGQFNMLTVFGVGEIPISLSGDPARNERLVHTIRAVGPVSAALTQIRPGHVLGLRGPFGTGWPVDLAIGQDVIITAGGLGLAPLRPALYQLRADRERYGRIVVLYGTRSPADILFEREIETWRRCDIDFRFTVDHATSGWKGNVGVVTTLVSRTECDLRRTLALVCGPEVMMRHSIAALRSLGLGDDAIYLSLERDMKCALGFCGRCQFGTVFVCRDGPVFRYDRVRDLLTHKEL
jgi:NAD(P)H-flavin reductase